MIWRIAALVCAVRGHREALWSNSPAGPIVVCARCTQVLYELL